MESLRLSQVYKRFGALEVLKGLSMEVPLKGLTFVIGKSGSGKSVLCRLAVGLLVPDAGEVELLGRPVHKLSERERTALRAQVPYLVQGPALLDWLTIQENVALAATGDNPLEAASAALARLGLTPFAGRKPRQVGPGIAKRAAIARALTLGPRYLLLDEPTTGLDQEATAQVMEALAQLRREGLGALVVSHDHAAAKAFADLVVEVRSGVVGYTGPAHG